MARFSRAIHVEQFPEHFKQSLNGMGHKKKATLLHSFEIAFITLPDSSGFNRAMTRETMFAGLECLFHAGAAQYRVGVRRIRDPAIDGEFSVEMGCKPDLAAARRRAFRITAGRCQPVA